MRKRMMAVVFLFSGLLFLSCTDFVEKDVPVTHSSLQEDESTLWGPMLEWSTTNTSYQGNPFDIIATVVFTHEASETQISTGMFYNGDNVWKWRFTGSVLGNWTYRSESEDPDLNNLTGRLTIKPNPDPAAKGFITGYPTEVHTKWARYVGNQRDTIAFIPQLVMYERPFYLEKNLDKIDDDIDVFFNQHGFNGFNVPVFCSWFDVELDRCRGFEPEDPNPDIRTFEVLEYLIQQTHEAGGMVHLWAWGDQSRRQTPVHWGINGTVDQRLQRYIAARLGPLPGWTMGYGFDLWEWVDGAELAEWHSNMQEFMGWSHVLGARASKNKLNQLTEELDYASYEQHRPDYRLYRETIELRRDKPAFSEDRFRIRENEQHAKKDYDMNLTRRGLWHSMLAGGVANIWGNLMYQKRGPARQLMSKLMRQRIGSDPYENPEWIKTYGLFAERYFTNDMIPCEMESNAYCLSDSVTSSYMLYVEDQDFISLDLPDQDAQVKAVLVDTKKEYNQSEPCILVPGSVTWSLPYASDWGVSLRPATPDEHDSLNQCSIRG